MTMDFRFFIYWLVFDNANTVDTQLKSLSLRYYYFMWRNSPTRALAASFSSFLQKTRARAHAHTHPAGLSRTSDQLLAETANYRTHNKHKRSIFGIRSRDPSNQAAADIDGVDRDRSLLIRPTASFKISSTPYFID
jgi:hypothetical protein